MQIYEKACTSRGQAVGTEVALMVLDSVEGGNWTAMEDTQVERSDTMNLFCVFCDVFDRERQFPMDIEDRCTDSVLCTQILTPTRTFSAFDLSDTS